MKQSYLILLSLCYLVPIYGQNGFAKQWHMAGNVHLDFSAGNPAVNNNSAMETFESNISYSDASGNLLFYSNMGRINNAMPSQSTGLLWNRNHEVMPNGNLVDSVGCQSAENGGIVIPDFNNPKIYHLYTTDCQETIWYYPSKHIGLRRTSINMALDGGLGDVIEKGTAIFGDSTQRVGGGIAATKHANGIDYWIVIHSLNYSGTNTTFYTFLVTAGGISGPYSQDIGTSEIYPSPIEISPSGNKIVYGQELFDFDNSTGQLSNPIDIGYNPLGTSFSPNGALLYTTNGYALHQYNLSSSNIVNNKVTVYTSPITTYESIGAMQMGPNCKIYVSRLDIPKFGVINLGNNTGTACDFVPTAISYTDNLGYGYFKFPNFIESEFNCQTASIDDVFTGNWEIRQSQLNQEISIHFDSQFIGEELTVVDMKGSIIYTCIVDNKDLRIDLATLNKGVYVVRLSGQALGKKIVL